MTEWIETGFPVDVQAAEYTRLLGYPRNFELAGRAQELAAGAIGWYAEYGRPWLYARELNQAAVTEVTVELEGERFQSATLRRRFTQSHAGGAVLAAVCAGPEIEEEAQRLWRDERPDEYYFLEVLGTAVVERLAGMMAARLCHWADARNIAVLPHDSPGYPQWDIAEQPRLLQLLKRNAVLPGYMEALDSGALKPKKSLLAVYGTASAADAVRRLTTTAIPCDNCSLTPCDFRRPQSLGERESP